MTFLFTVHLGTVWFMLLAYLDAYAWLSEQALFGPSLGWGGIRRHHSRRRWKAHLQWSRRLAESATSFHLGDRFGWRIYKGRRVEPEHPPASGGDPVRRHEEGKLVEGVR